MNFNLSIAKQFFPLIDGNTLVLLPNMAVVYISERAHKIFEIESLELPASLEQVLPSYPDIQAEIDALLPVINQEENTHSLSFVRPDQGTLEMDIQAIFSDNKELLYLIIRLNQISVNNVISNVEPEQDSSLFLQFSYENLYKVFTQSPHLTMIYQVDGTPLFFSSQVEKFTGLSQEELSNKMYEYLINPENRLETLELFKTNIQYGNQFTTEVYVRRKDGVYRWLEGDIKPIKSKSGEITHWFGSFIDIHERKENIRLMRDQMKNLDSMTRFLPQILWILKPSGLPSFFNWRWYKYTGLSERESLSRNWIKVIHKEDQHLINDLFVFSYENEDNLGREMRIISKDNEYRWFLCQVIPVLNEEENILQWLGTFTDINEQKQAEQQKDEFINIASHELKTPLTSIRAYLEIAQNYVDDKNPLSIYLNGASKGASRLTNLISSLLDVTRPKELVDSSQFDYFTFQTLLNDIVETFRETYPNRKIKLQGKANVKIYGDQQRLGQVLNNLLTNAVKYSPPQSSIEIGILCKNINFLEISVQDWGMGMPKKELKNIFKRYYRINSNRIISGLGLGLYICRKIIEAHGGWIFAESEEGKGSKLVFTLPISLE